MKNHFVNYILLLLGFVCTASTWSAGQATAISLEEALQIAQTNNIGLERDRLAVEEQERLMDAGILQQPSQIFLTGEEFDFANQSGIHSLNIQQNFYLPKVAKVQRELYQSRAILAENQLALTEQELTRQVSKAYYQLLFFKQEKDLANENLALYETFLVVATTQLESGETGKTPQLAALSRRGLANLELEHSQERYQIALNLFNQWLRSDILYEAQGALPLPVEIPNETIPTNNIHLQIKQAEIGMAAAELERQQAQLLPQINSGLKLQAASNTFPLFGYQLGINVPIFRKAYQGHIEAAEIGVLVEEKALEAKRDDIERILSELNYRLEHQLHIMNYLEKELTPLVKEQWELNLIAYKEGEIFYLEYLSSMEQVVSVKHQYLIALYEFNVLQLELNYWLGR